MGSGFNVIMAAVHKTPSSERTGSYPARPAENSLDSSETEVKNEMSDIKSAAKVNTQLLLALATAGR
ncbi:hypothetical protein F2P81_012738 [Scophthalmus maximus]|uniref:Uncharacterized protein n=1 Tax=Scophthalmus maximus TaxID=52904 RepID=A0A6A4SSV5_SCOMX|nr:hypothetical protein F2P81_012738 [Scophthalmus maximus]